MRDWALLACGFLIVGLIWFIYVTRAANMEILLQAAQKIEDTHAKLQDSKDKFDNTVYRIDQAVAKVDLAASKINDTIDEVSTVMGQTNKNIEKMEKALSDIF